MRAKKGGKSERESDGKGTPAKVAGQAAGPVMLTRLLLRKAQAAGATSVYYHVSGLFASLRNTLPHLHFPKGKRLSRHHLPPEHAEVLGRCHEYIIKLGKPIILSHYLKAFAQAEPVLTKEIMGEAAKKDVVDQLMVPVFGPFGANGVISFGFPFVLDWKTHDFLPKLEAAAAVHHNRLIRHFGEAKHDIELSPRENDVLSWIAKGKSKSEIATILSLSPSSVDTYTRRIFEKMGVNDRVSAAVTGLRAGLITDL